METIIDQYHLVKKCLGTQKVDNKKQYRKMLYTYTVEYENGILFYNLITSELIFIKNIDLNNIDVNNATFKYLIETWFLVPVECDEYLLYNQLLTFSKMFNTKGFYSYTILPTSDCNARCFYCFEKGHKVLHMSTDIAEDVTEFIIKNYAINKKRVSITWFGGEPLYNIEAINFITSKLNEKGIPFESDIITNGYLFDEEKIIIAKKNWNLKNAQITLDGTEKIYNRIKNYIYEDCGSPYKIVINNIKKLIEHEIFVRIRLNMDVHNKDDLYILVDELDNLFPEKKYLSVYPHLLFEDAEKGQFRSQERHETLSKEFAIFKEYIENKNFIRTKRLTRKFNYSTCMATSENCIVIGPDGAFAKCDNLYDQSKLGTVKEPNFNNLEELEKWNIPLNSAEGCKDCLMYPRCFLPKICPSRAGRKCDIYEQHDKIKALSRSMIFEYNKYKENK